MGVLRYHSALRKLLRQTVKFPLGPTNTHTQLSSRRRSRILDAGCGAGDATRILYEMAQEQQNHHVTLHGFDLTPAMLRKFQCWIEQQHERRKECQNSNHIQIEIREANILKLNETETLPSTWTDYDLVITTSMLEYLSRVELRKALVNLRQRLRPDGLLIVVISKSNCLTKIFIQKCWSVVSLYRQQEIQSLLIECGYHDVQFTRIPFPYCYLGPLGHFITARRGSD